METVATVEAKPSRESAETSPHSHPQCGLPHRSAFGSTLLIEQGRKEAYSCERKPTMKESDSTGVLF